MPKKLKKHLINFLNLTGVYIAVTSGLTVAHLLTSLVAERSISIFLEIRQSPSRDPRRSKPLKSEETELSGYVFYIFNLACLF
jgi:hypothetical protein